MRNFNKKIILIYIILILYILFTKLFGYKNFNAVTTNIINPLFYIITFIISIILSDADSKQRIKRKKNKYQTVFIVTISYLILYTLSGLFLGYVKSIYSHTILSILKNIWIYITPIVFIELTRNILIRNSGDKKVPFIVISIIFTIIEINLFNIINITDKKEIFKSIFEIIIPAITKNLCLTYISKTSGYITNLIYLLPQKLTTIILPIFPDLDWYFTGLFGILVPIFAFIPIKYIDNKIDITNTRQRIKKEKPINFIIITIPLIIFALFVAGFFRYKPTAIMSNSMHPIYDRGDVVIVEKSTKKVLNNLKKYDIIEYMLDKTIVAHRIIYIEKHNDNTRLYITKGDNNNMADKEKVTNDQIKGKVIFRIPKIGYPSVWLNEFLNKKEDVAVETGK